MDHFENTIMESFVFSKSAENKEEQQKYLDYSKMNFNSLQYIKPFFTSKHSILREIIPFYLANYSSCLEKI